MSSNSLIEAAKNGQLDIIRRLAREGYDLDYRCPPDGTTALYWAACNGHLTACDLLIRLGADVNRCVEKSGSIPLHGAADRGHADCALLLIRKGSNVDAKTRSNGDTPLHLASYRGHAGVCRILLQNGASADEVNAQNCTALDEARIQNHYDIYHILRKHVQRYRCCAKYGRSESCLLDAAAVSNSRETLLHPRPAKMITDVLNSQSDWSQSTKTRGGILIESTNSCRNFHDDYHDRKETLSKESSRKLDAKEDVEQMISEGELERFTSKSNELMEPLGQNSTPFNFDINTQSVENEDVEELVNKIEELVAYSNALQIQVTVREDEKQELQRKNEMLLERLECCKKIAEVIEESTLARMESEKRALRAERELVIIRKRCEALEENFQTLEKRYFQPNDCLLTSRTYEQKDELQPRG